MHDPTDKPSLLAVLGSVLSAMFGVQSSRKHERDFVRGSPLQYIVIGLFATIVFIATIYAVVRLVLGLAGV